MTDAELIQVIELLEEATPEEMTVIVEELGNLAAAYLYGRITKRIDAEVEDSDIF